MSSDLTYTQKDVKITPLSAPGADSNYGDWSFAALLHFRAARLDHILHNFGPKDLPPTWANDNLTFCATIAQIVDDKSNFKIIRKFPSDAYGMWSALRKAHEDQSSGGRIYWLYKLMLTRMEEGDKLSTHINRMQKTYERLEALITRDKPLSADDIYTAALVFSLTPDLLSVFRPYLSQTSTTSEVINNALEQDENFTHTRKGKESKDVIANKADTVG